MRELLPSGTPVEIVRTEGSALGVVIAPDIWGLRPLFDDLVATLAAAHGWSVACVEPFPGRDLPLEIEPRFEEMSKLDDAEQLRDLAQAADLLHTPSVAVIGFCMGGMYTFKAAGTGRFSRAAAFYGMIRVPPTWTGSGQGEPLDWLTRPGACPVIAILGGHDSFTPAADIESLRATGVTCVVYPEAEHGFVHDPSRPTHRASDAADAWRRVIEFLLAP